MELFSAEWLALREPADHRARAHDLTVEVAARVSGQSRTRAIDIAGGTGSNIRYLLPRVRGITHWTLVDHDPTLLAAAARSLQPLALAHGVSVDTRRLDLGDFAALPLDDCALVTASALLDLVSAEWMGVFARRCRDARVDVLCALSYDGRIACDPRDPDDERVRVLVNAHQRTDKGFGPALGPDAVHAAERAFAGWEVRVSPSDWRLGADAAELQRQLVDGWAGAAGAMAPGESAVIDAWRSRRLSHIDNRRSSIVVGHRDFAAWAWQAGAAPAAPR